MLSCLLMGMDKEADKGLILVVKVRRGPKGVARSIGQRQDPGLVREARGWAPSHSRFSSEPQFPLL